MSFLNYYDILNSKSYDSAHIIKENFQKLALLHHPDKKKKPENNSDSGSDFLIKSSKEYDMFVLINKAWNVLRDPVKRKHYDAELYENSISVHNNVFAELCINDFEENVDEDDSSKFWSYKCRCGGCYLIDDLTILRKHKLIVIECNECSLSVTVSLRKNLLLEK